MNWYRLNVEQNVGPGLELKDFQEVAVEHKIILREIK